MEFEGGRFTLAELERPIAHELFELRTESANQRVLQALLERAAKQRGVSVEQLLSQETDGKVPPKSDEELHSLYNEQALQRERDAQSNQDDAQPHFPSFDEFKAVMRQRATPAQRRVLEQRFFNDLLDAAHVRMHLDVLGRPRAAIADQGPSIGPKDAKVTIVEYTDFSSPFGSLVQPTLEKLRAEFPTQVRILFRQDPQRDHPEAKLAAEAALCAHDQGRYWEYRKRLFAVPQRADAKALTDHARELSLDTAKFATCLATHAKAQQVESDVAEARRNGLSGSPEFLVNGTRLSGAHELQVFERLIRFDLPAG